jgi:hypothetical protein
MSLLLQGLCLPASSAMHCPPGFKKSIAFPSFGVDTSRFLASRVRPPGAFGPRDWPTGALEPTVLVHLRGLHPLGTSRRFPHLAATNRAFFVGAGALCVLPSGLDPIVLAQPGLSRDSIFCHLSVYRVCRPRSCSHLWVGLHPAT